MRLIDRVYIDGQFVQPHGTELFNLHNPATAEVIGQVRLADEQDARAAIQAAKRAFPAMARISKTERLEMLEALQAADARWPRRVDRGLYRRIRRPIRPRAVDGQPRRGLHRRGGRDLAIR